MNKKLLICSIIAVAVLIGVSFTSVVGYRSIASDVKASPLFNIRTSRALDEESKDLSCEYVGKGEEYSLSIPDRDSRIVLIQKFLVGINKMEDEISDKFINLIISRINHNNIDDEEIVNAVEQLEDNQKIDNSFTSKLWKNEWSCTVIPCTIGAWFPGCFPLLIYKYVGGFIAIILYLITYEFGCLCTVLVPSSRCDYLQ